MIGSNFLQNISLPENINDGTGSTFIRINLYLNSLYTTFQSFMLGVGPGNYQYNINPMFNTQGIINPHNWWLEILTNYGLLVFFGYCCFFLYMLVKLFKIYRENNDKNELALILFLSLSGFSIGCMGPSSLFYFWPMWLLYGVSLGYISKKIQI
jgi:O-antigen ligase